MNDATLSVSPKRLTTCRHSLTTVLDAYVGRLVTPASVQRLLPRLLGVAGLEGVSRAVLEKSLAELYGGGVWTAEASQKLAARLAGGAAHLREGRPVPRWRVQPIDEWAACRVLEIAAGKSRRDKSGWWVRCTVLEGFAAGEETILFWPLSLPGFLSNRVFGFSRRPAVRSKVAAKYPYGNTADLIQMRFSLWIERELSIETPTGRKYGTHPALKAVNRSLIKARLFKNSVKAEFACPHQIAGPCRFCPIGYLPLPDRPSCPAACRPRTYTYHQCHTCNRDNRPFDPARPAQCVTCADRERMDRKLPLR